MEEGVRAFMAVRDCEYEFLRLSRFHARCHTDLLTPLGVYRKLALRDLVHHDGFKACAVSIGRYLVCACLIKT